MSTHEILTTILDLSVNDEEGVLRAHVARSRFAEVVDELVNCRTLLAQGQDALSGSGLVLAALYGTDDRAVRQTFGIHAVLHDDSAQCWLIISSDVPASDPAYPAVTPLVMAAHWYERALCDLFGVLPVGHPDLRRLLLHPNMPLGVTPLRKDFIWEQLLEQVAVPYSAPQVLGEGVYEPTLGPVSADFRLPGQYRFQVAGERIVALESRAFYGHRGVEKILEGSAPLAALAMIEEVAVNAAVAHTLAFVQAVEHGGNTEVTERAQGIRTLLCELERVTAHIADVTRMLGHGADYQPLLAHGSRLQEDMRRLSHELAGNRFWRGLIVPGGVSRDLNANELRRVAEVATQTIDCFLQVTSVALRSEGLQERLEMTGVLPIDAARAYGAVGVVARASGLDRDVRRDHPYAAYHRFVPRIIRKIAGDVEARMAQRLEELKESRRLLVEICKSPGQGRHLVSCVPTTGLGIGAVEGASGEVVYVVLCKDGHLDRIVIRDASFCNWSLINEAAIGNALSDFPLIEASFGINQSAVDL